MTLPLPSIHPSTKYSRRRSAMTARCRTDNHHTRVGHTDNSHLPVAAAASLLRAIELPDVGGDVADRVGQIWGFGPDGEMANMWKCTPQQGLWFIAGGLGQCRIYSKYLALQIKAIEEGLLPRR